MSTPQGDTVSSGLALRLERLTAQNQDFGYSLSQTTDLMKYTVNRVPVALRGFCKASMVTDPPAGFTEAQKNATFRILLVAHYEDGSTEDALSLPCKGTPGLVSDWQYHYGTFAPIKVVSSYTVSLVFDASERGGQAYVHDLEKALLYYQSLYLLAPTSALRDSHLVYVYMCTPPLLITNNTP